MLPEHLPLKGGSAADGPLVVGAAGDAHEQEADAVSGAVARRVDGTAAPQVQRRSAGPQIRRYQSGDAGHGGIEEQALTDAGFSKDDAAAVYFGNWLRDFSQVPHEKVGIKLLPVLNILAQGEFGRTITQDDLGTYVPSEHIDNPMGGGSVEDDDLKAKDPAAWKKVYDDLSPAQKAAYDEEEKHRAEITAAAKVSGLPAYIERGKMHSKQTLEASIKETDPVKQKLLLGSALHAIEDYFSHSNFVEACIMILKRDGVGGAKLTALSKRLAETTLGPAAVPVDAAGAMQIQTGTYKPGANETVSQLEILHTEILNGQLTKAFVKGLLKQKGLGLGDITRSYARHKGGDVGHSLGSYVDDAATLLIGTGVGATAAGTKAGEVVGDAIGAEVDKLFDEAASAGLVALAAFLRTLEITIEYTPILHSLLDAATEAKVADLTKQAQAEAPVDPATGKAPPTHTELAKDAPDNSLFGVSSSLAKEVDRQFGVAIQAAWAKGASADPRPVTDLVDTYVSHPEKDGWWRAPLLAAVS